MKQSKWQELSGALQARPADPLPLSASGVRLDMTDYLALGRCPHCQVNLPNLHRVATFETKSHLGYSRTWGTYVCQKCGGVVTASTSLHRVDDDNPHYREPDTFVHAFFPQPEGALDVSIPKRARDLLAEAIDSQAVGAVLLCSQAVDAMLQARGYTEGDNLNLRIREAANQGDITEDMANFANEVRLDANAQRHSKESAPLPTDEDRARSIAFARALAEYLFVLPAEVERGRKSRADKKE